ncbi:MAG: hypothetical protein ACK5D5_04845 [Bacteroidota bacterium]|jgi:carbon monoxide dehydrogenase subunit G
MSFKIESKPRVITKKPERLSEFLSNFHHFKDLLPEDKIENWTCTETSCSFTYSGVAEMSVLLRKTDEPGIIHYHSATDSKFPFDLYVNIIPQGEHSLCKASVDVHLSKGLKLFLQKPLENLADSIIDKLEETNF